MRSDQFYVKGIPVDVLAQREAAVRICDEVASGTSFSVFTLNLDHVVKLRRSSAFRAAYERARIVLADGFPIAFAGRLQGKRASRTTGADLIEPLCAEASQRNLPVAMLGSTLPALAGAARRLLALNPKLTIAGAYSPPSGFDVTSSGVDEAIAYLKTTGARICFVALGAPKQELFADHAAAEMAGICFVCIGAGLDFLAGLETRAPALFQKAGIEWIWRLAMSPRRLLRRYVDCLLVLPSVLIEALARE